MISGLKKKIKIIALILAVFMLELQPTLALTNSDYNNQEIQVLERMGIASFGTIIGRSMVEIGNDEKTEYEIAIGDIINKIVVLEDSIEKTSIRVTQDSICNVLEIYKNGDMILDGNEVDVTYDNSNVLTNSSGIVPSRSGYTIYWKGNVSYGTASNYNHFLCNENVSNISLNEKIENIALSALVWIMSACIGGTVKVIVDVVDKIVSVYNYFIANDPNTKYLSSKSKVYTHGSYNSGYIPSLFTYIYKYKTTFYSRTNYNGEESSVVTTYKYKMTV